MSVSEMSTLDNKFLDSINAHMFLTERATRVNFMEEPKAKPETVTDEQDRSRNALAELPSLIAK